MASQPAPELSRIGQQKVVRFHTQVAIESRDVNLSYAPNSGGQSFGISLPPWSASVIVLARQELPSV